MPLLKYGKIIDDPWVHVDEDTALPAVGSIIISLARWLNKSGELGRRQGFLGIRLNSDQPPSTIAGDLDQFAVIALDFPIFADGRAYSYARVLCGKYGFKGEIRAVGNILRDQYQFMRLCGFDAFEVAPETRAEDWDAYGGAIGVYYQPDVRGQPPVPSLRPGVCKAV